MLWRNRPRSFSPKATGDVPAAWTASRSRSHCQHYGKALSVDHWEETCDYYIRHFPFETYGKKWTERKGQAIHVQVRFQAPALCMGRGAVQERRADVRGRFTTRAARGAGRWRPSTSARYPRGGRRLGVRAAGTAARLPPDLARLATKRVFGRWEETVPRSSAQGSCEPCRLYQPGRLTAWFTQPAAYFRKARPFDECRRP